MPITLVLADDHPLMLDGLVSLFARETDFEVLASCSRGDDALDAVRQNAPDVLVVDVNMPGKTGLEVLKELASEKSPTRSVILTAGLTPNRRSTRFGSESAASC